MKFSVSVPAGASAAIAAKLRPLAEKASAMAMPKIAALAIDRVTSAVGSTLKTTAQSYLQGLGPDSITLTDTGLEIRLSTPIARALELGADSFDMKAHMLIKAKRFSKKGDPYIDIPFQFAASANAKNLQGMPKEVHAAMQKAVTAAKNRLVKAGFSADVAKTATVRLRGKTPGKTFDRELTFGGKKVTTHVEHKRGLHDDMIRTAVLGPAGKPINKYGTMRRISAKSDPSSWWHPGFKGVHLFDRVAPAIKAEIKAIIRDSFASVGLKVEIK